jgi:hypothetical protein
MAEIKPDLIPITNYLVWKNDTETNLIDKYLPKEFKDRPYQICRTNEISSCKLTPAASARSCALAITGPSAIGSENATPSSITSAPLATNVCMSSKVLSKPLSPAKPTKKELSGIFENIIKKFNNSTTLMRGVNPNLTPVTNYLVWKNDTETNLIDKYLPKEFKDRPYQICRTNEICEKLSTFGTRLCQE